jgi:hypothetical protein
MLAMVLKPNYCETCCRAFRSSLVRLLSGTSSACFPGTGLFRYPYSPYSTFQCDRPTSYDADMRSHMTDLSERA